ncbi:carboxypeptidase regulatory-like domain-containing protein [Kribbella sp. NPDC049584]|uniref:carboxypeptidase regulatory-like domain-containing protein n=1 Tax=Kribbella sp. NPDC049584 TaxID=3154833 RepID=UPI0034433CB5
MTRRGGRTARIFTVVLTTIAALMASAVTVPVFAPSEAVAAGSPTAGGPHGSRTVPAGCNVAETAADGSTPLARCYAVGWAGDHGALAQRTAGPLPGSLGPADIRAAYALPDGGAGRTVAIVDAFGYENAESDLAVFRAHYGLPPCTTDNGCFRKIDQRGGTDYPQEDPGWSIETALDLDAVSSACPDCHILLVQADSNSSPSLGQAVDTAASLGAVAISNSYGIDGELPFETYYDHYYDHPGVAVTVSSGDVGNVQSYPATSPNVISVGGTNLSRDDSAPRGWHETAWTDGGSGCSLYEPRPDYQDGLDTGCPDTRATADVSAVADPETGLAVYNTLGQDGWAQYGGTSLSAPLVAAMYALAGTPVPGSNPVTYLYRHDSSLNDVTEGADGSCGDVRCTAGAGWDGPTGVGTPNGVSALTLGSPGWVSGSVRTRNQPLDGATVTFTDKSGYRTRAVVDKSGNYRVAVAAGTYRVVASKFGYADATFDEITVSAGATLSRNFALTAVARRTVSGTVTDGSGQGWPMYAKISIDGYPDGAVHTDPFTGRYSVELPVGRTYKLRVQAADLPGYQTADSSVAVGNGKGALVRDVALGVDESSCTAAGYGRAFQGAGTGFEGWSGAQDDWTVTDDAGSGKTWTFDDPGAKGNLTGAGGQFAIVDNWSSPVDRNDTSLVSPVADLSGRSQPVVGFDTYYYDYGFGEQDGVVDLSLDGGATWQNVWRAPDSFVQGHVEVPIPQAANKADVRVRFRFSGAADNFWELDDVYVGNRSCEAAPGGLVAGFVRDHNTGAGLTGVQLDGGTTPAVSHTTTDDSQLADGYYSLFAPTGNVALSATGRQYAEAKQTGRVAAHRTTRLDWSLEAGRVTVTPSTVSVNAGKGPIGPRTITLTNHGTKPAQVSLVEQDRGFTATDGHHRTTAPGAPLRREKVDASPLSFAKGTQSGHNPVPSRDASTNPAWSQLPNYPTPIMDNVVAANDGVVYSVSGATDDGLTAAGYAYDRTAGSWRRIADLPEPRESAVGGFVAGKLYVTGGWDPQGNPSSATYAYDPAKNRWSRVADLPVPSSASSGAVVGDALYVVAGCASQACTEATPTYRYDVGRNTWTRVAAYPEHVVMAGCTGSGDGLICAGGLVPLLDDPWHEFPIASAYQYKPDSDSWAPIADMPYPAWGMAYSGSGGKLQLVGGITGGYITNQAVQFDPATGAWSDLPNATYSMFRGSAACGLSRIGGSIGGFTATPFAEYLSGQDACVLGADVSWLSADRTQVTVPAGRSVTVRLRFDAAATSTAGKYDARLAFTSDTPYGITPATVTLTRR